MPGKPFVYISYSRTDREIVAPVVDELQALGVQLWVDSIGLSAGESWERQIADALAKTTVLVAFISPKSVQSKWTTHELAQAAANGAQILPVLIDSVEPIDLPIEIARIQWLDATRFSKNTFAKSVAAEIGRYSDGCQLAQRHPSKCHCESANGSKQRVADDF